MSNDISPEDELRLQIQFDTRYEFLLERNAIEVDKTPTRKVFREAVQNLSAAEREVLESRVARKQRKLTELIEGDYKSFDEPHIEHEDLVDGVRIPGFND